MFTSMETQHQRRNPARPEVISLVYADENRTAVAPFVFIKTHKTASGTVTNILDRLSERRGLVPLPCCRADDCSGSDWWWPRSVPPARNSQLGAFDCINGHVVLDPERMRPYLTRGGRAPLFFSIVRDPLEQSISSLSYYSHEAIVRPSQRRQWTPHLNWLQGLRAVGPVSSRFINSMAHDLGWYDWVLARHNISHPQRGKISKSTRFNDDDGLIAEWLTSLTGSLDLIMLQDAFDESLVILHHRLGVTLQDMAYLRHTHLQNDTARGIHSSSRPVLPLPTSAQASKLLELNRVDVRLYAFAKRRFWQAWENVAPVAAREAELAELRRHVLRIDSACIELFTGFKGQPSLKRLSSTNRTAARLRQQREAALRAICTPEMRMDEIMYRLRESKACHGGDSFSSSQ